MTKLIERIGYAFNNDQLLIMALTHSSYANENRGEGAVCNERLEFLGDAVLGLLVAEYLYGHFPEMPEGKMTKLRSELVCEKNLSRVAEELQLGQYLRLGKGEEKNGGCKRPSILADAVEATLAAIYLDGGKTVAEMFVSRFIISAFEAGSQYEGDYKTELQELVQRQSGQTLTYELVNSSGPDHEKIFTVQVILNGCVISSGSGHSKKDAEQAAAGKALEALRCGQKEQ